MADGDIRKANIGPNDAVLADFRLSFEEGKGYRTVSRPTLTPFSTKVVEGSMMVTPSSMRRPTMRSFMTRWA